jgi:UDP-N-acetylglucosamine 2-epimerase (non-hydrolysing)
MAKNAVIMKKQVVILVGTRPNFIKVTQFKKESKNSEKLELTIVHTGQHYDVNMAEVFFDQFDLRPDIFLNISNSSPNSMIAEIMLKLEELFTKNRPDLLIVVGDVNSTMAGAVTANKMNIKLAHLESGLRSFDRSMPEEINRVVTDQLTDYFFVTEQSGYNNLLSEGKGENDIYFVGNNMIDTLVAFDKEVQQSDVISKLNLDDKEFVLMTMHRPATVDSKAGLDELYNLLREVCLTNKVVFPIHPRTKGKIEVFGLLNNFLALNNLIITEPLDYFAFQKLVAECKFIITDSGGIQEESTFRLKPCLTLRPNTERPSTVDLGTNTLIPYNVQLIRKHIKNIKSGNYKKGKIPELWDGKSTGRIIGIIESVL